MTYYRKLFVKATFALTLGLSLFQVLGKTPKLNVTPLMKCLGLEELEIHRNKTLGPIYNLNQLFINELASIYGVTLKERALKKVCQTGKNSASVNLLELLILNGRKVFKIEGQSNNGNIDALAHSTLSSFTDREIPKIFFNYLSQLQSLAPMAPCLDREIPEITYFLGRFKYLETDMSPRQIINEPKKIKSIFDKLEKFDQIVERCKKMQEKISKENKKIIN